MAQRAKTVKEEDCQKRHDELESRLAEMHTDVRRIISAVCGDLEGHNAGILQRVSRLEGIFKVCVGVITSGAFLSGLGLLIKYLFYS